MKNDKLKDKIYPKISEDTNVNTLFKGITKKININDIKKTNKIPKKNLPELKLTNLKSRTGIEFQNKFRGKSINNISFSPANQKNNSISKKQECHSLNKNEKLFPKLNSNNNKNISDFNFFDKKNISLNNFTNRKNFKIRINNNIFVNKESKNNEDLDNEKERELSYKNKRNIMKNEIINVNNNKTKLSKIPNKKNIKLETKLKIIKNNYSNFIKKDNLTPNASIIHPLQGLINKKINNINDDKQSSNIINELKELEIKSNKLNIFNNLYNTIGVTSPLNIQSVPIPIQKTINLSSEIFKNKYKNFEESIISKKEEIDEKEYIKGYGYNSSKGNIRDYNEDSLTVTKIYFNDDKTDYCYYFGIYDGHGGNGCSNYLKDNLHMNIKEFSKIGIKIGIDIIEERFKTKEALDENGEIKDSSGSCGIILLIKKNRCIIANIGDSRLVIFKNRKITFSTIDHKPNYIIEKARIEMAGGKIYQTPSIFPLYQNGKKVDIPYRVLPGRLSVSRTFGDIQAKDEKFGGNKTVIIALPDITEIELNDEYNLIIMGSDGIFDVLSNEELLECIDIVLKEKEITGNIKNEDIHQLCGDFTNMIIKSALAKESLDNITCIVIALNLNGLFPIN
jgi:serine/threonine protein phosphatase PrpC